MKQSSLNITYTKNLKNITIDLPGSKSESNRALIINALAGGNSRIRNLSEADDTKLLKAALISDEGTINVENAGTAMRFLMAYYAAMKRNILLTGNERMQQRPVKPLVQALQSLGANIEYLKAEGYPPIKINGEWSSLKGGSISIPANISSQFISALLMIAPVLERGLQIELEGTISSKTYIEMTLGIMAHFGIEHHWRDNIITITHQKYKAIDFTAEADWSSASYWYSIIALSENAAVFLKGLKITSFQGDAIIRKWAEAFGVISEYSDAGVFLTKSKADFSKLPHIIDFSDYPDLAQTIIPLFAALGISCKYTGLESLRIKETDRIIALQNELKKFDIDLIEESEGIFVAKGEFKNDASPAIETYEDHRMALSFAPLVMRCNGMTINNPDCVRKSYPGYWDDLQSAGFLFTS